MRQLLILLLSALCCLSASAEVYTYIDKEGNRVFTDQPPRGNAQKLNLAPPNAMPNALPNGKGQLIMPPPLYMPAAPSGPPAYQLLRIIVPEPDASIHNGSGDMIVTLNSEPGLLPGHSYRLLLDGEAQGEASRSPVFSLQHIDRGTHQLVAEIIDSAGLIVERTPAQPFHMHRMTLAQKRKVNPCKKDEYGVRPECPLKDKPKEDVSILPFF